MKTTEAVTGNNCKQQKLGKVTCKNNPQVLRDSSNACNLDCLQCAPEDVHKARRLTIRRSMVERLT